VPTGRYFQQIKTPKPILKIRLNVSSKNERLDYPTAFQCDAPTTQFCHQVSMTFLSNVDAGSEPSTLTAQLSPTPGGPFSCSKSEGNTNPRQGATDSPTETSIQVFRRWLTNDGTAIDASAVMSKACFDDWCTGRSSQSSGGLCRTFQRVLTAHIAGSDGRRPFEPEEEAAILTVIRKKQQWPAFKGTTLTIGCKGCRAKGYHERQKKPTLSTLSCMDPIMFSGDCVAVQAKRGAAEMAPKVFIKRARLEYPSTSHPFWIHAPSALPTANVYGIYYDGMATLLQNQRPLLGMHNQLSSHCNPFPFI